MYEGFYWVGVGYLLVGLVLGCFAVLLILGMGNDREIKFKRHNSEDKHFPFFLGLILLFIITVIFWPILLTKTKFVRSE